MPVGKEPDVSPAWPSRPLSRDQVSTMMKANAFAGATLLSLWMAGNVAAQQPTHCPQPTQCPPAVVIQQAPACPSAQAPAAKADCVVIKDDCGRDHCFQLLKP